MVSSLVKIVGVVRRWTSRLSEDDAPRRRGTMLAVALLLASCGQADESAQPIGGPCQQDRDCGVGRSCWLASSGFPDGYCVVTPCEEIQCPDGSTCALLDPNTSETVCLARCTDTQGCRAGYGCRVATCWPDGLARPFLDKINEIPDYEQTDSAYGGFAGGGQQYCGPTSASNALMWLDDHGYDTLIVNTPDRKKDQHDCIVVLGASDYMNALDGTSANDFLVGLDRFVREKDYTYVRLDYQGWRSHPAAFDLGTMVPELEWIQHGIESTAVAWINIGWYTYESSNDTYSRQGGHWLTVVGYGFDGTSPNPDYLVLHDPWVATGNRYVRLETLASGTLAGNQQGLPRDAAGYFNLTDGMAMSSTDEAAILDGAVVLEMP